VWKWSHPGALEVAAQRIVEGRKPFCEVQPLKDAPRPGRRGLDDRKPGVSAADVADQDPIIGAARGVRARNRPKRIWLSHFRFSSGVLNRIDVEARLQFRHEGESRCLDTAI
jgi:hypothetical protein